MALARLMTAGVDLWLNTPQAPLEASGTSGMKAAVNGVPSLSVLDGWWIEGCIEGVTGWSIGGEPARRRRVDDDRAERRRSRSTTSSSASSCRCSTATATATST